jgi:PPOX class probable F420-dependent enzyme
MDERIEAFIAQNVAASMITLRPDGTPHAVRVGVAVVDGKVWSSGTQSRVRTRHLRRDPRSTLFIFESGAGDSPVGSWRWLSLDCTVTILDGPDAPDLSVRLFQVMQAGMPQPPKPGHLAWYGQEKTIEEFRQAMVDEQRLIYEFEIKRAYGMY